mmetsp:Transcript_1929/g.4870  ORF Transcript_1929/g.4870 Transcript_1929/m.4870 type:complete len:263 (+) Transcript_1929:92-880(+)
MLSRGAALQRGGRRLVRRDARQRPRRADQDAPSERRWSMLTFRLTPGAVRCCGTAQLHRPRTSTSSRCCRRATPTRPTRPTSGGSAPRAAAASGGCSSIGSRRAGGSPLETRLAAGGVRPGEAPLQLRGRAAAGRRLPGRDGARALRRRRQGRVRARLARRAPLVAVRRVRVRRERGRLWSRTHIGEFYPGRDARACSRSRETSEWLALGTQFPDAQWHAGAGLARGRRRRLRLHPADMALPIAHDHAADAAGVPATHVLVE